MQGHPDWKSTAAITCSFAVIFVVVVWTMRKNSSEKRKQSKTDTKEDKKSDETVISEENIENNINHKVNEVGCSNKCNIPELSEPKWRKVGQIQELYVYPLKSGRGKGIREGDFTEYGISIENKGHFTLRDRMFLVYNEETGRFQTGRKYPTLILVSLAAVDETRVKLEAVGMPSVIFSVPKSSEKSSEAIQCTLWWGETVKCIDCGPEPAEWLSRFLTGTNSGLRLGCAMTDRRNVFKKPWDTFTKVYKTLRNEDTGLFSDLASYMLMTTQSVEKLNEKLERPVPALQFRPNILVSTLEPFEEDQWEWIRIGEHVVIRNVKPCTSFRELSDPELSSFEGDAPVMGIYCGLYVPGKVKIGDEVFVHVPQESSEESCHRESES
ncbi:mitochondrial amidoxime-reducing component 1 isoform X2 [Calliopsis andreniformis]|uniref:mitochondrial amidoxime-reducing component 1 isoform X2 n=1 Tax=Calliopsis andreniformis TaxID=337506 RepID=UPI003FCD7ED6